MGENPAQAATFRAAKHDRLRSAVRYAEGGSVLACLAALGLSWLLRGAVDLNPLVPLLALAGAGLGATIGWRAAAVEVAVSPTAVRILRPNRADQRFDRARYYFEPRVISIRTVFSTRIERRGLRILGRGVRPRQVSLPFSKDTFEELIDALVQPSEPGPSSQRPTTFTLNRSTLPWAAARNRFLLCLFLVFALAIYLKEFPTLPVWIPIVAASLAIGLVALWEVGIRQRTPKTPTTLGLTDQQLIVDDQVVDLSSLTSITVTAEDLRHGSMPVEIELVGAGGSEQITLAAASDIARVFPEYPIFVSDLEAIAASYPRLQFSRY